MLFDPNWKKHPVTPHEVFDLCDFVEFVAAKPASERYCYTAAKNCAVAQYLQARGVSVDSSAILAEELDYLHDGLSDALNTGGHSSEYTFGALHGRLLTLSSR